MVTNDDSPTDSEEFLPTPWDESNQKSVEEIYQKTEGRRKSAQRRALLTPQRREDKPTMEQIWYRAYMALRDVEVDGFHYLWSSYGFDKRYEEINAKLKHSPDRAAILELVRWADLKELRGAFAEKKAQSIRKYSREGRVGAR